METRSAGRPRRASGASGGSAALLLLIAALFLGACREDEQDRVIGFEPGVYQGKADSQLNAEQEEQLRLRVGRQGG